MRNDPRVGSVVIPGLRPEGHALSRVLSDIARSGVSKVLARGSDGEKDLHFEVKISARGPHIHNPNILARAFSASIKFGGGKGDRRAKVCVAKLDGAHGFPHLHLYNPVEGQCAKTGEEGGDVRLPWYRPESVRDAVLIVRAMFFAGEVGDDKGTRELPLTSLPPQAGHVRLVLPVDPS